MASASSNYVRPFTTVVMDPNRVDFIDAATRDFFPDGLPPFQFVSSSYKRRMAVQPFKPQLTPSRENPTSVPGLAKTHGQHIVTLQFACPDCPAKVHVMHAFCNVEQLTGARTPDPCAEVVCASYATSIAFWKRVVEVHIDGICAFNRQHQTNDFFNSSCHAWVQFSPSCRYIIEHVLDLVYTFVLDHSRAGWRVKNWVHFTSRPGSVCFMYPHMWAVHGMKWGALDGTPLVLNPVAFRPDFLQVYSSICQRMGLPPLPARHVVLNDNSLFGEEFGFHPAPHLMSTMLPMVQKLKVYQSVRLHEIGDYVRVFPRLDTLEVRGLLEFSELSVDFIAAVAAGRRLQSCKLQFPGDSITARRRSTPPWRIRYCVGIRDIVTLFIGARMSLKTLLSADFDAAVPLGDNSGRRLFPGTPIQKAFYGSDIFERHVIGIIDAFVHGESALAVMLGAASRIE